MRQYQRAAFAIMQPIALAPQGAMSGDALRCAFAEISPRGVGYAETIEALEHGELITLCTVEEHGQRMAGYQLTVLGENLTDVMMNRQPRAVVRNAAYFMLETAHRDGLVQKNHGGGHVGPARAAMIFDSLLGQSYLERPFMNFGAVCTVGVITTRGLLVLNQQAPGI